ncbi:hypothetical protein Q4S45_13735 [Massilia sp. R2A-15]|uniref:hypothetical protein n=1 Tax=Massilia sp. R2A-15 TaxID=3064278 RepID=UPI0027369B0E|nr:hypothetical protein [Massilia sp. R2A-15]WLI87797.1 hypothetical protein Q4S45_13735 [Massilia sp. R2A-15]
MTGTIDPPSRHSEAYLEAAARLEQPLGQLAEAMDEVERVGAQIAHSTYMAQVVADRAKYHQLQALTQPESVFAATLADRDATARLMQLLAPSLVFPAMTPMQIDFSGEALHHARQAAELHKENLRKMITAEVRRIDALGDPA